MQATTPVSGGQTSIQILLEAEKDASREVQGARQYRVERLKAARKEAEEEILALKSCKKEQFALFEKSIVSGLEEAIAEHNKETELELKATLERAQANKDEVVKLLMEKVLCVQPQLHPNRLFHLNKNDENK